MPSSDRSVIDNRYLSFSHPRSEKYDSTDAVFANTMAIPLQKSRRISNCPSTTTHAVSNDLMLTHHVCRLRCSLTLGLRRVDFHSKVNTELATNGEDFHGICTSIHDFETVRRCMRECERRIAFLLLSFAHYASTRTQRRGKLVDRGAWRRSKLKLLIR